MYKLDLKKAEDQRSNCLYLLDQEESKGIPNNIYFCFIDYTKAFDCVNHKLENSSTDGSTRPHYLSPKKTVYSQEAKVRTRSGTAD